MSNDPGREDALRFEHAHQGVNHPGLLERQVLEVHARPPHAGADQDHVPSPPTRRGTRGRVEVPLVIRMVQAGALDLGGGLDRPRPAEVFDRDVDQDPAEILAREVG